MKPLLEVDGVSFTYPPPGDARPPFALSDLTFAIAPREVLGLIGPNSAGKTTLIRLLTKVLDPGQGTIAVEGKRLDGLTRGQLARLVAVVPQHGPQALAFTVEQLVLMGRYPHSPGRFFETAEDRAIASHAMALTGVLELASASVESLSGGERQRVMLARALAQRPRLLILDEPTAHLDLRYQVESVELLRRVNRDEGMTILLASHDLNLTAALSDRLLLLAEGRIARLGSPREVLDEPLLSAVYGCAVVVGARAPDGRPVIHVEWSEPQRR